MKEDVKDERTTIEFIIHELKSSTWSVERALNKCEPSSRPYLLHRMKRLNDTIKLLELTMFENKKDAQILRLTIKKLKRQLKKKNE